MMTHIEQLKDIKKHSKGIWLTYRIPYNKKIKDIIVDFFKDPYKLSPIDYSYQYYGTEEVGHISIRICAYNIDQIKELNKFLESENIDYEVSSYDEQYHVKLAYLLATKLVENLEQYTKDTYINIRKGNHILDEIVCLVIHGIFNNLELSKKDEIQVLLKYIYQLI